MVILAMRITDFIPVAGIIHRLQGTDASGVVHELGMALARLGEIDGDRMVDLLLRREHVGTTAAGHEVAVPHARSPEVAATVGVVGLSERGVDFRAPDGLPVRIFVGLVSPIHGGRHLHAIACIARDLNDERFRRQLFGAADARAVHRLLAAGR
jgi:mannitol/fructose-specific phosphotransferase system IIA component (Ntr-type)